VARLIGNNVTVLNPGGDVLALWESCTLDIDSPPIDMTAVADAARQYMTGHYGWTVSFSKLVNSSRTLPQLIIAGGTAAFTMTEALGGKAYSGAIRFTRVTADLGGFDSRQMESATAQGDGALTVT
jgi:hypothetical protein